MEAVGEEEGYRPAPEFHEDAKEPLVDLTVNDSTELWLIQWSKHQKPDFDGQEVSLKLHHDGNLGSLEGSSGKEYDVVSFVAQQPNATVFVPSALGTKIAGKISRRVSLVHYPEPSEHENLNSNNLRQMYQMSAGMSLTNSSHNFATPARSTVLRNSRSTSGRAASSHSSRHKSSLSDAGEPSQLKNKRNVPEPTRSRNQSTKDSGRSHSAVTSSRLVHSAVTSSGQGQQSKSRKKIKDEN